VTLGNVVGFSPNSLQSFMLDCSYNKKVNIGCVNIFPHKFQASLSQIYYFNNDLLLMMINKYICSFDKSIKFLFYLG